jgi:hypothetical protein
MLARMNFPILLGVPPHPIPFLEVVKKFGQGKKGKGKPCPGDEKIRLPK